jgi:hypothetical protein
MPGTVTATTGFQISIKYAIQVLAAFIHPGEPITVMYVNLYGNSTAFQTLALLQGKRFEVAACSTTEELMDYGVA